MKTPESGTEVFNPTSLYEFDIEGNTSSSNGIHGYLGNPTDAYIQLYRNGSSVNALTRSRLTGSNYLVTSSTAAEVSGSTNFWDNNVGSGFVTTNSVNTTISTLNFRRAPGFFDVVAYTGDTGTGSGNRVYAHNLGVTPELMITKARNDTRDWYVNLSGLQGKLNTTDAFDSDSTLDNANTTATHFYAQEDTSTRNYIVYLFATLPGISKVGSYTGNGTSQTIDCGFSTGARFVLIKRTDSTSNWNVFDTERGIVAGNDPRLELNTTDAEDTGDDGVDPDSSGFAVNYIATNDDDVRVWNANVCEVLGIDPVLASPRPEATGDYKTVVRDGVTQDANGNWVYAWVERDMFATYTDEDGVTHTKAEQEQAYQARKDAEAAGRVRETRNGKLSETDWTVLQDSPMTSAQTADWVIYRQALRDITDHANFPYLNEDDWPTKP